jgi:hypothetical protein
MKKLGVQIVMLAGALLLVLIVGAQAKEKGNNNNIKGVYAFRLVPVTSFAPFYQGQKTPSGTAPDSGVATAPRQDILRVGVFTADDKGNIAGHAIATTDNGLTTLVIDYNFSGTSSENSDGTGTMSINPTGINSCKDGDGNSITVGTGDCTFSPTLPCSASECPETYALVVSNLGPDKPISLIQTDNVGGGAKIFLTGEAKRNARNTNP